LPRFGDKRCLRSLFRISFTKAPFFFFCSRLRRFWLRANLTGCLRMLLRSIRCWRMLLKGISGLLSGRRAPFVGGRRGAAVDGDDRTGKLVLGFAGSALRMVPLSFCRGLSANALGGVSATCAFVLICFTTISIVSLDDYNKQLTDWIFESLVLADGVGGAGPVVVLFAAEVALLRASLNINGISSSSSSSSDSKLMVLTLFSSSGEGWSVKPSYLVRRRPYVLGVFIQVEGQGVFTQVEAEAFLGVAVGPLTS
jgi:hypothetical protein